MVVSCVDIDLKMGEVIFLDENGSVIFFDLEGFKKEFVKDEIFLFLLKSGIVI